MLLPLCATIRHPVGTTKCPLEFGAPFEASGDGGGFATGSIPEVPLQAARVLTNRKTSVARKGLIFKITPLGDDEIAIKIAGSLLGFYGGGLLLQAPTKSNEGPAL